MAKTFYLCYFGLREPLVQTQVLPYLRELMCAEDPIEVSLLTFETDGVSNADAVRIKAELAAEGIEWNWLTYHKRFSVLATAYDIFRGTLFTWNKLRNDKIDVLHGRVHVPTLMGAVARKFSRQKPKLLFDIRGFFPEEYTDAGRWAENGLIFRSAKRVEKWLLRVSDGFVVLTERAREILFPESLESGRDVRSRPVEVIPCCVDIDRVGLGSEGDRLSMRERLGISDRRVITYVGSFGGWYMTKEMMDFLQVARESDPSVFALILTQRETAKIAEKLKERGFSNGDFFVASVRPDEIAGYLEASDLAISFIKACYSKQSSSPTKIAEYLACGVPVITGRGVGDVAELIECNSVGIVVDSFDDVEYLRALDLAKTLEGVRLRCRTVARDELDLKTVAGPRYRRIYNRLLNH